jgi:hypothetical protein
VCCLEKVTAGKYLSAQNAGDSMSKADIIQAKVDEIVAGGMELLKGKIGEAIDMAIAEIAVPPVATDVKAQIDAAVAAAGVELHAELDAKQADLDKALSDDKADKDAVAKAQSVIDGIRALLPALA